MATSDVQVCNRALQKLGAQRIVRLDEATKSARACNTAYTVVRDALLQAHRWVFAIKRATLPAVVPAPTWGPGVAFQLPSDYLKLAPRDPEELDTTTDWRIEGTKIITNDSAPLYLRYVARVVDPNQYPPLFRECLSTSLAAEICEELTQSTSKKAALFDELKMKLVEARRANAIEQFSAVPPIDDWITGRE